MKGLRDNLAIAYVSFWAFASDDFEAFLVHFQHVQPVIHMLYPDVIKLLLDIFVKLIKRSVFFISESVCSNKNLFAINPLSPDKHKSLNLVETKTLLLNQSVISNEEQTKFRKKCLSFYMICSKYLMDNLPFQSQEMNKAKFLHHKRESQAGATRDISNLA